MDLEAIALRRAQEQLDAGAWKRPEKGEREPMSRVCQVPGCENGIHPAAPRNTRACKACREAGWVAETCRGCGGRLRRVDQGCTSESRRGYCQACRAEMPVPLGGFAATRIGRPRKGPSAEYQLERRKRIALSGLAPGMEAA